MMNILYLHGLMSSNKSQKTEWLNEEHVVHNPVLNYKEDSKTIFKDLELLCKENNINIIIGSSMGGYLGFHLSNKFNIPSLLFNPSLEKNNIVKPEITDIVENSNILHTVILGKNDDVVIPEKTIKFLESKRVNFVHFFESNGHRTPLNIFKKHFLLKTS